MKMIEQFKDALAKSIRSEIRISYDKSATPLGVGASKIGGCPHVPTGFVYPEYTGEDYDGTVKTRPLSFMAQINLKDISGLDSEGLLPETGVLSFFYDVISQPWGFDPNDKGSARVYYFPDENVLSPLELPGEMEEDAVIPEFRVKFEKHASLPGFESVEIDGKNGYEGYDDYEKACVSLGYDPGDDGYGEITKLLGFPDVIQNPMEEECERISRGYSCGCPEDYQKTPKEEIPDIEEKAKEWTLLFQMGTVETDDYELMFGDCGHIYFWIRKSDLEKRDFDNVWLILQCG